MEAAEVDRRIEAALRRVHPLLRQLQGGGVKEHATTPTTSAPTTTSTASPMTVVLNQMTVTADFGGFPILIVFSGTFQHASANGFVRVAAYDNGAEIGGTDGMSRRQLQIATIGHPGVLALAMPYTPAKGSRTIDIRWGTAAGTATAVTLQRSLAILEFRRLRVL